MVRKLFKRVRGRLAKKPDKRSLNYRRDHRSKEQFHKDIIEGSKNESIIIERYSRITNCDYEDLGHDDGSELKPRSTPLADFLVNGEPVEVKYIKKHNETFHLKRHHIDSYVGQDAKLLFVMGLDDEDPVYSMIDPKWVQENCEVVMFWPWRKRAYKCFTKDFEWHDFSEPEDSDG